MEFSLKILFYSIISLIIVNCSSYHNRYYNNGTDNKSFIIGEQYPPEHKYKKLEKISVFHYHEVPVITCQPVILSHQMIDVVQNGEDFITLEFRDKNDKLFTDLQRLLETARIDSTMILGRNIKEYEYKDGIDDYFYETRHPVYGLIIHLGQLRDIKADEMILYQYSNGENDTICCFATNTVRINSYIAKVDSVLFQDISHTLRKEQTKLMIEIEKAYIEE